MPSQTITCPACDKRFDAELEAEVSLPSTGGDFDWCESTEGHDCPYCHARLGVSVRVWLGSFDTEIVGITVRPPRPVAGVPARIRVSPGGDVLVGYDGGQYWCWRAHDNGWRDPDCLSDRAATDLESGCPAMAFADDGRLLLANGDLFTAGLEPAGSIDLPRGSLVGLGWLAGKPALAWRDLASRPDPTNAGLTESYWRMGIRRHRDGEAVDEAEIEAHSGLVMSGRFLFDERRDRVCLLAPPTHGRSDMTAEALRLEGSSLRRETRNENLSLTRLVHHAGDVIALGCDWFVDSARRRGIEIVDAETLQAKRRIRLPDALFGDFDSLEDLCFLDETHLLVSTGTTLARVKIDGAGGEIEHVYDLTHVRSIDGRTGRAWAATDWELVEIAGDELRPLPLPEIGP